MLSEGYPNETIAQRMAYLSPVAMRLELKEGVNSNYFGYRPPAKK